MQFSEEGIYVCSTKPIRFTLIATGDCCPGGRIEAFFIDKKPEMVLGKLIDVFLKADHVLFNLETPLCVTKSPIPKCGPNFSVHPDTALGLKLAGLDLAALANNHILDQGMKGLAETLSALNKAGIRHHGAALTHKQASRPMQVVIKGKSVGFLNFAEGEFSRAKGNAGGAARLDSTTNRLAIEQAAATNDFTIVSVHGGNEYQPFPSPCIQQSYRNMISAGANVVLGHHPHVPQGVERYENGVIIYSLGDFLFDYSGNKGIPGTNVSFLPELNFDESGLQSLRLYPFRKNSDATLSTLEHEEKLIFIEYINKISTPLYSPEQLERLWEQEIIRRFETFYSRAFKKNVSRISTPSKEDMGRAGRFFLNMFDCDAHREALKTVFKLMHEGRFRKDGLIQHEIDILETQLKTLTQSAKKESVWKRMGRMFNKLSPFHG